MYVLPTKLLGIKELVCLIPPNVLLSIDKAQPLPDVTFVKIGFILMPTAKLALVNVGLMSIPYTVLFAENDGGA